MILLFLLVILFGSGILVLLTGSNRPRLAKAVSYAALFATFFLLLPFGERLNRLKALDETWLLEWQTPWIEAFNIHFHLGLSVLSFWFCLLALILGCFALFISTPKYNTASYYALLLWSIMGVIGIFLAIDLFLFFIFWELALIPLYSLIFLHGGEERKKALIRYVFFTQASGLILLFSLLGLVYLNFNISGQLSFNYHELISSNLPYDAQCFLLLGFLIAFLIKLPVFPVHGWIPSFFKEAPVALILIAVLAKTSVFGLLRFSWALFPQASAEFALWLMMLGAFSMIYGALLAFGQRDPKMVLAYGIVSHAGLLLVGIFSGQQAAFFGVLIVLLTQALSTAALLSMIKRFYHSSRTVDIYQLGGLWHEAPAFSVFLLIFLLAGIGLPFFGNFVGEWLVFWGIFLESPSIAIACAVGLFGSAVYSLWLFQRFCFGATHSSHGSITVSSSEIGVYGLVTIILLLLGLCPALLFQEGQEIFPSVTDYVAVEQLTN